MTQEMELPPARASRAHRAAVLNDTYNAAVLNGVPAVAGPVDGDAWARYANSSMLNKAEYAELVATVDLTIMEPTC
ncbi:hypothetical protein [Paenarthrobacter ilicis]|uniref:hypothetical protein n=1 Tax=Paenarthrobacter ilicis TaxID=43665 RepID=UPI00386D55B4